MATHADELSYSVDTMRFEEDAIPRMDAGRMAGDTFSTDLRVPMAMFVGGLAAATTALWKRGRASTFVTAGGLGMAAVGLVTIARRGNPVITVTKSVTINRPRTEVFAHWHRFAELPRFMRHIERVEPIGPNRYRWTARQSKRGPRLQWEAEITHERDDALLMWQSLPGSDVETQGVVEFVDAPGNRGTELHARVMYRPPGGRLMGAVAQFMHPMLAQEIKQDLQRFKQFVETGEVSISDL